jgi:hypothetical protein
VSINAFIKIFWAIVHGTNYPIKNNYLRELMQGALTYLEVNIFHRSKSTDRVLFIKDLVHLRVLIKSIVYKLFWQAMPLVCSKMFNRDCRQGRGKG